MFSLPFPTFLLSDMKLKVLAMLARLAVPLEALYYGALRFVNFKYEIAEVDRYYIHTYIHTHKYQPTFICLFDKISCELLQGLPLINLCFLELNFRFAK